VVVTGTALPAIEPRCFTCHNVRVLFDYWTIEISKYGKTPMNKNEKRKEVERMMKMVCKLDIKKPLYSVPLVPDRKAGTE
jgi:hypothetical protein